MLRASLQTTSKKGSIRPSGIATIRDGWTMCDRMANKCLIEICCGSVNDAVAAGKGGAYSVELCSDLFHGGLTPTVGDLLTVKKYCPELKVNCMVRPREGGFNYTELEFEAMLLDAKEFIEKGADGIVFGFLNEDGTVNRERTKKMLEVIGDKESVFHRAVDVTPDWKASMDILMELGVTRMLTSGQEPTVPEGISVIKEMIEYAKGAMQVMPGGGITQKNAQWVMEMCGCNRMHIAMHRTAYDRSTQGNTSIFYGGCVYPPEDRYSITVKEDVSEFVESFK